MKIGIKSILSLVTLLCSTVSAQEQFDIASGLTLDVEASATASSGEFAPLWLSANRQGVVSPYANSAYERVALSRSANCDSLRKWRYGYGIDLTLNQNNLSTVYLQQAYADVHYYKGYLTVGARENTPNLRNASLSSGAQTLGINARPIPQIRLGLDYWTIPLLGRWVSVKGHMAYGMYMDTDWQKEFTRCQTRYVENQLYHEKAGFLKIHKPNSRLTIELGLEMATQFGGTSHLFEKDGEKIIKSSSTLSSIVHAFVPGGTDYIDGEAYNNAEGNFLGSWLAKVNYDFNNFSLSLYADKYFEDHSSMFLLDYDGYGSGDEWDVKKDNRFFMYDLKDINLGCEFKLHKDAVIDNVVVEYMNSRYQSGAIYHDHSKTVSDHIGGRDDFYNHSSYTGWQHYGMVSGNPMYLSPLYNKEHDIYVHNGRFTGWHGAFSGRLAKDVRYRALASWQKSWGTYFDPFIDTKSQTSLMIEAVWTPRIVIGFKGMQIKGALGYDEGELRGKSFGAQLSVRKTFGL